jgi:hypothetical protein
MKTIAKFCLLFAMIMSFSASAQKSMIIHKGGPLREDNIINTKSELRKEKLVHKSALNSKRSSEYYARKKHKLTKLQSHKPKRKKIDYEIVTVNKKKR